MSQRPIRESKSNQTKSNYGKKPPKMSPQSKNDDLMPQVDLPSFQPQIWNNKAVVLTFVPSSKLLRNLNNATATLGGSHPATESIRASIAEYQQELRRGSETATANSSRESGKDSLSSSSLASSPPGFGVLEQHNGPAEGLLTTLAIRPKHPSH